MWKVSYDFLKPSDKFFLIFPNGWVPLYVVSEDIPFEYIYDPISDGGLQPLQPSSTTNAIIGLTFEGPNLFGSKYITGNPNDVFKVEYSNHMYQIFFGVAPSYVRVFRSLPQNVNQGNLDISSWNSNYFQFGFIDGYTSPFDNPSPITETAIPYGLDIGFTLVNPTPLTLYPLFKFIVNRVVVSPITNVDIVYDMFIKGAKKLVVGGMSPYPTNLATTYGVTPINPSDIINSSESDAKKVIQSSLKG